MVLHGYKGDIKIVSKMLKNLEEFQGEVKFKAPLVVTAPTYNIIDELKEEGDWEILQKYSGFEFNDDAPKNTPEQSTKIFYTLSAQVVIFVWVIKKKLKR